MLPTVTVKGDVTGVMAQVTARVLDCSPAMERIRREVFEPAVESSWVSSGLHELTGALRRAVTPWSGQRSAGVTLRARRGRFDRDLIYAKAAAHTYGRKKWSSRRVVYRAGYRVSQRTGRVKWSTRAVKDWVEVRSPWGDIPARPFFPESDILTSKLGRMKTIVEEYLNASAR